MRVFIILATIAFAHGAKLENTYLPPSHAQTSGGSGNFLQTPIAERAGRTNVGFSNGGQNVPGSAQSGNGFAQSGNGFAQSGNGFAQTAARFEQSAPGFSPSGGNSFAKNAQFDNVNGFNNFGNFEARPERPRAALERNAAILRQDNSNDGENFAYSYETENGIYAEESGIATNGVEAQGGFSYTGDDGQVYSIRYTADQNGFVPVGDHLPTPPPVPEEILRALEQNARDEAAGIFDDGSYNEAKYAAIDNNNAQYNNNNAQYNNYNGQSNINGQSYYQQPQNTISNDEDSVVTNAAFSRSLNYPEGLETPKVSSGSLGSPISRGSTSGTSRGLGSNGSASGAVDKAYLPPFATQDRFGRRQNFDSRNGYQY